MGRAHSVTVALTCDGLDGETEVFAPARWTAQALVAEARERRVPVTFSVLTERKDGAPEALRVLEQGCSARRRLRGNRGSAAAPGGLPLSGGGAGGPGDLPVGPEEGVRYRDIVVAARTMEGYGALLEPVFGRYGIPLFYGRREEILDKPFSPC